MRKILLLIVCFLFTNNFLFSQETPYQKKIKELKNNYFTTMGLSKSNENTWQNYSFESEIDIVNFMQQNTKIFNQTFASNVKSSKGIQLTSSFLSALRDAKKLRTNKDFELDNDKSSDSYELKRLTSNRFLMLIKKGEFEKTEDFNSRKNQKYLDSLFNDTVLGNIKYITRCFESGCYDKLKLGQYNADKEQFTANYKNDKFNIIATIKVPFSEAENFKNNFDEYKAKLDLKDLKFWKNNLIPIKLTLVNSNKSYTANFIFPNDELKNVTLNNRDIYYYDNDLTFDLIPIVTKEEIKKEYIESEISKKNQFESKIKRQWVFGKNNILNLMDDKYLTIDAINSDKDNVGRISLEKIKIATGNWILDENRDLILTWEGEEYTSDTSKKTYIMYNVDVVNGLLTFSQEKNSNSRVSLNTFDNKQIKEMEKNLNEERLKKEKNNQLLKSGTSLLKSILK